MCEKKSFLNEEEILNKLYCSFEKDPTGKESEIIVSDLLSKGIDSKVLVLKQQEACFLYNKNCF